MAMAGALLVTVPCTTAAFPHCVSGGWSRGHCEGGQYAGRGEARLVNRCVNKIAGEEENGNTVSAFSCGLQLTSSVKRRIVRNAQLGWRGSSNFLRLDGSRIGLGTKVQSPRKLLREALRITAENFDPKNFDPKKIDVNNVVTTLLKLGKQGLEAGTKLVPDTVPRPVAQLGVGLAGLFVGSFVIRSLFSTVFFVLAIGGLGYIAFLFFTKGEGGSSSGSNFDRDSGKAKSTDEALEEARRIMDKYK